MGIYRDSADMLETILDELVGGSNPFVRFDKWLKPAIDEFPCIQLAMADSDGETRFDNESNEVPQRFIIRCMDVYENDETNHNDRYDMVDTVLEHLRAPGTVDVLRGAVQRFDVERVIPIQSEEPSRPILGFDIVINLYKLGSVV